MSDISKVAEILRIITNGETVRIGIDVSTIPQKVPDLDCALKIFSLIKARLSDANSKAVHCRDSFDNYLFVEEFFMNQYNMEVGQECKIASQIVTLYTLTDRGTECKYIHLDGDLLPAVEEAVRLWNCEMLKVMFLDIFTVLNTNVSISYEQSTSPRELSEPEEPLRLIKPQSPGKGYKGVRKLLYMVLKTSEFTWYLNAEYYACAHYIMSALAAYGKIQKIGY